MYEDKFDFKTTQSIDKKFNIFFRTNRSTIYENSNGINSPVVGTANKKILFYLIYVTMMEFAKYRRSYESFKNFTFVQMCETPFFRKILYEAIKYKVFGHLTLLNLEVALID